MLYCLQLALIMLSYYLHKFSCPPENSFWPGSPESKQGVPVWVSGRRSIRGASLPCSLSGACGKLSCLIMEPTWCSAYSVCMADYMVEMGHENGHAGRRRFIFFETLWFDIACILYSVFVNRRFGSCFNSCRAHIAYHIRSWLQFAIMWIQSWD